MWSVVPFWQAPCMGQYIVVFSAKQTKDSDSRFTSQFPPGSALAYLVQHTTPVPFPALSQPLLTQYFLCFKIYLFRDPRNLVAFSSVAVLCCTWLYLGLLQILFNCFSVGSTTSISIAFPWLLLCWVYIKHWQCDSLHKTQIDTVSVQVVFNTSNCLFTAYLCISFFLSPLWIFCRQPRFNYSNGSPTF